MSADCLVVTLKLSDENYGTWDERGAIHAFASRLEAIVKEGNVGEYDGDEFGGGECSLYFYGEDADKLFEALKETLRNSPLVRGGHAVKEYASGRPKQQVDFP